MTTSKPNKNSSLKKPDDLAHDLQQLIKDSYVVGQPIVRYKGTPNKIDEDLLMQNLTIFITRRDHLVFNHGHSVGWEKGNARTVFGTIRGYLTALYRSIKS